MQAISVLGFLPSSPSTLPYQDNRNWTRVEIWRGHKNWDTGGDIRTLKEIWRDIRTSGYQDIMRYQEDEGSCNSKWRIGGGQSHRSHQTGHTPCRTLWSETTMPRFSHTVKCLGYNITYRSTFLSIKLGKVKINRVVRDGQSQGEAYGLIGLVLDLDQDQKEGLSTDQWQESL